VAKKKRHTDGQDAFALFPDLLKGFQRKSDVVDRQVLPPSPPDVSWLRTADHVEQERVEEKPTALVLTGSRLEGGVILSVLAELGYQVQTVETSTEAINRLKYTTYAVVLMHTEFERKPLAESVVHNYIKWLPLPKRRTMFYILVGPHFHTLYDLEALSLSVNLTIHDADVEHMKTILSKSFRDHEKLFGPLIDALSKYKKV